MTTAVVEEHPAGAVSPREWWQVWAQRRAEWWATRPVLARRWATVRAVGLWVGLVWVLGLFAFVPEVRLGVRAWLGCVWVVVAWYFLARTKSLTWTGFLRFFTACVAWSFVIGLVSTWLATEVVDRYVLQDGPSVMIASITEETLKLVPLAVLALLAPRRVARFAVVDWLLLGLASGTAFLLVEESLRRVALATGNAGMFLGSSTSAVPDQFTRFGWWALPGPLETRAEGWGGHGVVTAIVAAWVGLAVVAVRAVRGRADRQALWVRVGAVGVPVLALLVTIADHAATNGGQSYVRTEDGTPKWLDPGLTNVPLWIRGLWSAFGHGHHRPAVLVALLVVVLVVDAGRLARVPAAALVVVPRPGWVDAAAARVGGSTLTWPAPLRAWARGVGFAVPGALWVITRDLRTAMAGFARSPDESRRAAAQQGATALAAQRAARELGYEALAHPVGPSRRRGVAAGALLALLVGGLVLAPIAASRLDTVYDRGYWLAGVLGRVDSWWHDQPLGMQIAIGVGIAALIALSGGSLGLALGISGVLTWGLDKSAGIATFVRDPDQATRDYLVTATPAQLAADTLGFVLTFGPGALGGAVLGRGVRTVADDVVADPAGWLARQRALLREAPDAGEAQVGMLVGRPVLDDGAAFLAQQRQAISRVFRDFPRGTDDATKAAWYRQAAQAEDLPDYMRPVLEGRAFHHEVYGHFDAAEVTINQLGADGQFVRQFRVDGLSPGEIMSVKSTQLSAVSRETAEGYIKEMLRKYNPNRPDLVVAPTTGNAAKLPADALGGRLEGDMVLVVPPQTTPVPDWLVQYARDAGDIEIRELVAKLPTGGAM